MAEPSATPDTAPASAPTHTEKSYTAALVGATGQVGSRILTTLLSSPSIEKTHVFARRPLPESLSSDSTSKLNTIISKESETWHETLGATSSPSALNPAPSIFFSGLGTTRAAVGGFENQKKIDLDLNLSLAKSAKEAGVNTYVLISSHGANAKSMLGYPAMKGQLEDEVVKLGFANTVFLRPGLIGGRREESRPAEAVVRRIADWAGSISGGKLKDFWAQDDVVIGRAAVAAALKCENGQVGEGKEWEKRGVKRHEGKVVWEVAQGEIVRLGSAEWKGGE